MSRLPPLFSPRKVLVALNLSGAWRELGCFNLDKCDIDTVLDAAEAIVINNEDAKGKGKLRITLADGSKLPLMYWSEATGWEVTRHAHQ